MGAAGVERGIGALTTTFAAGSPTGAAAGPAARDARLRVRLLSLLSSVLFSVSFRSDIYICLGAIIRSTQFSAGVNSSLPGANTPVAPLAGSAKTPVFGS